MTESTNRVVMDLTQEQAAAVSKALDFYVRMCIGQLGVLTEMVRDERIPISRGGRGERVAATPAQCESVDVMMNSVKAILGYPANGSNGVGHAHVHLSGRRNWEVKKALDQVLAQLREPNPSFKGVHYDGITLRYTDDPLPVVRVETRADGAPKPDDSPAM